MRKITFGLAVSLDGFIEGPNGEYDWCFTDQDYGMNDFLKDVDTIFYGRKSFEVMEQHGSAETMWPGKKHYIFSNTLNSIKPPYQIISGDVRAKVEEIQKENGKNIWLFGGASLASQFLTMGLLNELWLSIHPILLGKGTPLFKDLHQRSLLQLKEVKQYSTGLVSVKYDVQY